MECDHLSERSWLGFQIDAINAFWDRPGCYVGLRL